MKEYLVVYKGKQCHVGRGQVEFVEIPKEVTENKKQHYFWTGFSDKNRDCDTFYWGNLSAIKDKLHVEKKRMWRKHEGGKRHKIPFDEFWDDDTPIVIPVNELFYYKVLQEIERQLNDLDK